uniref:Uncharacterized protein n=1 Tax=Favella ehrenbergii TaxID=182087 RepID=A0A7S3HWP7_9SPIT|mmetsp:Transcript_14689/g.18455  ORF Transcript_14689/g.18455 Transcript_14689/m.18455 type:complete len:106 (+) Transcript_14689:717-1034(+)
MFSRRRRIQDMLMSSENDQEGSDDAYASIAAKRRNPPPFNSRSFLKPAPPDEDNFMSPKSEVCQVEPVEEQDDEEEEDYGDVAEEIKSKRGNGLNIFKKATKKKK